MDEPELEERLRRRLHARFDGQDAPEALHDRVIATLGSERSPSGRAGTTRSVVVALRRQLLPVAAVVILLLGATVVFWTAQRSPRPSCTTRLRARSRPLAPWAAVGLEPRRPCWPTAASCLRAGRS